MHPAAAAVSNQSSNIRNGRVALLGGASITGLEYLIGVTLNRRHRIWDYRKRWMNLQGQICPAFALAWCGLSGIVLGGMRMAKAKA